MTEESKTMTDLVERLEDHAIHFDSIQYLAEAEDIRAAIATIEAQAREIERLDVLRADWRQTAEGRAGTTAAAIEEMKKAISRANTARRDALEGGWCRIDDKSSPLPTANVKVIVGWDRSPGDFQIMRVREIDFMMAYRPTHWCHLPKDCSLQSPVHAVEGGTTTSSLPGSLTTGDRGAEQSAERLHKRATSMFGPAQNKRDRALADAAVIFLNEASRYFSNRETHGEDKAFWANVANAETCSRIASLIERRLIPVLKQPAASGAPGSPVEIPERSLSQSSPPPAKGVTEDEMVTLILREWMAGGESYSVWEGGSRGFWAKLAARAVLRALAGSSDGFDGTDKHTAVPCAANVLPQEGS